MCATACWNAKDVDVLCKILPGHDAQLQRTPLTMRKGMNPAEKKCDIAPNTVHKVFLEQLKLEGATKCVRRVTEMEILRRGANIESYFNRHRIAAYASIQALIKDFGAVSATITDSQEREADSTTVASKKSNDAEESLFVATAEILVEKNVSQLAAENASSAATTDAENTNDQASIETPEESPAAATRPKHRAFKFFRRFQKNKQEE